MMINALNSGAKVFMADFEDANSPTWDNVIKGQVNLQDAVQQTIELVTPDKTYTLAEETATLVVRPRGWHLPEKHFEVDGEPVSASLFDFGLYVFHNGRETLSRGFGPYYYLPKLESHLEARLWDDVLTASEDVSQVGPRVDQGDRAHRDDHRRVRDGRDPLRAARPHLRSQRRPVGLHLQRRQALPPRSRLRAAGPVAGDHDHPVYEGVYRALG